MEHLGPYKGEKVGPSTNWKDNVLKGLRTYMKYLHNNILFKKNEYNKNQDINGL